MGETQKYMVGREMGCGFMGTLFGIRVRKPSSVPRLRASNNNSEVEKSKQHPLPKPGKKLITEKSILSNNNPSPRLSSTSLQQIQSSKQKPNLDSFSKSRYNVSQVTNIAYTRKLRKEPSFTDRDLSMTISVRDKSTPGGTLYRASSGNAMVLGHLGNLKQTGNVKSLNYHLSTRQKKGNMMMGKPNNTLGNIYGGNSTKNLDPEVFKNMGNEKYKQGRFEEAIALYNEAIGINSNMASYYSNRSAALIGLGRVMEALLDCKTAIRIDPSYHRAHYRLATLYLRLGEAEKALCHYKCSGSKAENKDIALAQALKTHLGMCIQVRKIKDWNALLNQSQFAVSLGADSAPQVYCMQAEALLNLHKHQEAYSAIQNAPNFDTNICVQLFGSTVCANFLTIQAKVYMAAGRFEEAVACAQRATEVESSDEVNKIAMRTCAVAKARSNGNKIFKASKFSEAFILYSQGLKIEPYNSVLLCNRAACQCKLGQFEKAVEDCTMALSLQPSYAKAIRRRAECNAKLERWEAAIEDYKVLIQGNPRDEEMERALFEAQIQLKKKQIEDAKKLNMDSSKEQLGGFLIAPGEDGKSALTIV